MVSSSVYWKLELLWSLAIAALALALVLPVFLKAPGFPYIWTLFVLIFVFFTITRYIFLLHRSPFAKWQKGKFTLAVLCIPVIIYCGTNITEFQIWFEQKDVFELLPLAPTKTLVGIMEYARTALILFGAGSFVAAVILPFRLAGSIWRTHNLGTV